MTDPFSHQTHGHFTDRGCSNCKRKDKRIAELEAALREIAACEYEGAASLAAADIASQIAKKALGGRDG